MRIISGIHRGRTIRPPKNLPVRPTTDKAKEGLFNILNNRVDFEELDVLDLFCGTGNISFEFVSREVKSVTCVDQNFRCIGFVKSTMKELGQNTAKAFRSDAFKFVESTNQKWNLIFADPPYDYPKYHEFVSKILERKLLLVDGILIVEHPAEVNLNTIVGHTETRKYGRVHFSFFQSES
jgi:16S rRNA (guanine(966)-N(2))-methyltransferase RsmD